MNAGLQAKDLHEWGQNGEKLSILVKNLLLDITIICKKMMQLFASFSRIPVSRSLGDFDNDLKNLSVSFDVPVDLSVTGRLSVLPFSCII